MTFDYGRPVGANTERGLLEQIPDREFQKVTRSTVPLMQLWLTESGRRARDQVLALLGVGKPKIRRSIFEYTAPATCDKCSARGKVSCTDLMLETDGGALAIEAKYKEGLYPSIKRWRASKANSGNADAVLRHWINHSIGLGAPIDARYDGLVYQLVHRTASACIAAGRDGKPGVVLLLFSDAHLEEYSDAVWRLAQALEPRIPTITLKLLLVPARPDVRLKSELAAVSEALRAETLRAWLLGGAAVYRFDDASEVSPTQRAPRGTRRPHPSSK